MSVEASRWARVANVQKSSSKLILLNLAQLVRYDSTEWTVFASIEYLSKVTHLNRKTVIEALARLRDLGAIQDTGQRMGDNRSSIVYRLCPEAVPTIDLATAHHAAEGTSGSAAKHRAPSLPRSDAEDNGSKPCGEPAVVSFDRTAPHTEDKLGTLPAHPIADIPITGAIEADGQSLAAHPARNRSHALECKTRNRRAAGGASRLPPGWALPEDWRQWTQRERPHWSAEKIEAMATTFYAYQRSRPGSGGVSCDWFESWRLWVFRERGSTSARRHWHETWSGIVAKGKTLGVYPAPTEPAPNFKRRVFEAAGLNHPH